MRQNFIGVGLSIKMSIVNANNKIQTMIKEFQNRAAKRRNIAYILLVLTILIILCTIGLVIWQLQDLSTNKVTDVFNILSRLSFIALATYVSQLIQKLYRYNLLKSDYSLSCADALTLSSELESKQSEIFSKIFSSLNGFEVTLSDTDSPKFPFAEPDKPKDDNKKREEKK